MKTIARPQSVRGGGGGGVLVWRGGGGGEGGGAFGDKCAGAGIRYMGLGHAGPPVPPTLMTVTQRDWKILITE